LFFTHLVQILPLENQCFSGYHVNSFVLPVPLIFWRLFVGIWISDFLSEWIALDHLDFFSALKDALSFMLGHLVQHVSLKFEDLPKEIAMVHNPSTINFLTFDL
jgi:hypothetical protein